MAGYADAATPLADHLDDEVLHSRRSVLPRVVVGDLDATIRVAAGNKPEIVRDLGQAKRPLSDGDLRGGSLLRKVRHLGGMVAEPGLQH